MVNRVELCRGYLLHQRVLSDSRKIIDVFTDGYGRISGVIRVGKKQPPLLPFQPYLFSWMGRNEFKSFTAYEVDSLGILLTGNSLFCGFYLNELLQRLLPAQEDMTDLFGLYQNVLTLLPNPALIEPNLRRFELVLLRDLGYEYSFEYEGFTQEPLQAESYYCFLPQQGFILVGEHDRRVIFKGADILNCASTEQTPTSLQILKRVCRTALAARLGREPLKSREFFVKT